MIEAVRTVLEAENAANDILKAARQSEREILQRANETARRMEEEYIESMKVLRGECMAAALAEAEAELAVLRAETESFATADVPREKMDSAVNYCIGRVLYGD